MKVNKNHYQPPMLKDKRYNCRKHDKAIGLLTIYSIFICCMFLVASGVRAVYKMNSPITTVQAKAVDATAAPLPTPDVEADPETRTRWDAFMLAAKKVSKIYNFPANVVIAQGALESARGSSSICKDRNNCLGIGAVDWDPNQAYRFENMEQSIVEYMTLIRKNFPEAWNNRSNPDMVIYRLKYNSDGVVYATDPSYVAKVKAMPEWQSN